MFLSIYVAGFEIIVGIMQVNSVRQNIGSVNTKNRKTENIQAPRINTPHQSSVNFTGGSPNIIVGLMDFIAAGGFAASFCIQDGLGFIAPRVYKGLKRGGKKKVDENGNEILNKNGEPKRELNWAYARKEGIREIITGPSAFVIPFFLLKGINKKFGRGNSVKLDYIDGFKNIFTDYANENKDAIINSNADKKDFYKSVFKEVIETTINENPKAIKIENVEEVAEKFANKQKEIDNVIEEFNNKSFLSRMLPKNKKLRDEKLAKLGSSITDDFMELKKKHVGSNSDHAGISLKASDYTAENKNIKHGNIGKLTEAMSNYFDDAVKSTHETLKNAKDANIEDIMKKFTSKKLGSRILTNLGLFAAVALFYTQIPKLYNMGTGGKNPALMNDEEEPSKVSSGVIKRTNTKVQEGRNVSFGSGASTLGKFGDWVYNTEKLKKVSDIFELNGPIIQGQAMAVLLYGACIPPRLIHAQDKYDFSEIVVRDMTAFTALLFGAKALARLFSDGFTKITGLALNNKNLEGRNILQKTWDYLNPANTRHAVLSSKELESKYTNIRNFKDGVNGFVEFIEESGGNIKKALSQDKEIKKATENILKEVTKDETKTFATATKEEIKKALSSAKESAPKLLDEFYSKFHGKNKLLIHAKTCNSAFDFLSTIVLVPLLIYNLTNICQRMTEKRRAEENRIKNQLQAQQAPLVPSSKPTMQGFLNRDAA